jgi:eukaryotic-like serine/threonine-protein kinase
MIPHNEPSPSLQAQKEIDAICVAMEDVWLAGETPAIGSYLDRGAAEWRKPLLNDLMQLDIVYRRQQGKPFDLGQYLELLPQEAALVAELYVAILQGRAVSMPAHGSGIVGDSSPRTEKSSGESSVSLHTVDAPHIHPPGTLIAGRYKLLEQIGEGGMGTVWVAEQSEPVRRRVAVKLIKPGMDSRQVVSRFRAEQQALALMDHPNIAKVFDGGMTDAGRPFFVMELVKGVPITEYCDSVRLPIQERLKLFIAVCQAVQHAHQKGVIHRDLKPSNILVCLYAGQPVPKVIDFGLAKAISQPLTEHTLYTAHGLMVGTPLYMSPEQAEFNNLDVDTRTDIYSLGVILYELLTGSTPLEKRQFKDAAIQEILRLIKEVEPPKPSTKLSSSASLPNIAAQRNLEPAQLSRLIRGDLDWIVMKALEKDRSRRYETANGLARDIERHLHDEPVEASPPSASYRLRKLAHKHRALLTTSAAIASLLVLGAAVSTYQAIRATRAEVVAKSSEQKAIQAGTAERVAKEQALAAAEAEKLARQDAQAATAAEQQARQEAQAAATAESKAKESALLREAETKAVLSFVEDKIFSAARPEGQEGGLGREVTLRRAVEGALPFIDQGFKDQPLIEARLRMTLGSSFQYLGETRLAVEQFQAARALYANHLGPEHSNTLRSMQAQADGLSTLDRHAEAIQLYETALALNRAKFDANHREALENMGGLADAYDLVGRRVEALQLREEALALAKAKLGPHDPTTITMMNNLAFSYGPVGRRKEAVQLLEEALTLTKARLGPDHPETLNMASNLASFLSGVGRLADAIKLCEETLAVKRERLGPGHIHTLSTMGVLADLYLSCDRVADSVRVREEALELMKVHLGRDRNQTLRTRHNLASIYSTLGRHADALQLHEETLALRTAKLGASNLETLRSMANLATSLSALGRHSEALKLHEETLALLNANHHPEQPDRLETVVPMAQTLDQLGRGQEAAALIKDCLQRTEMSLFEPRMISYPFYLRMQLCERIKDVASARLTAETWERLNRSDPISLYTATCLRALTSAVIRIADTSEESTLEATAEADHAMKWLQKSVAAGYTNSAQLARDKALDSLRDRDDFKLLLAEMEAIQTKGPEDSDRALPKAEDN